MRKQNDQWKDKDKFPVHSIRIMMHKINEFKNVPETKRKEIAFPDESLYLSAQVVNLRWD